MFELVAPLIEKMGGQFGELVDKSEVIEDVIRAEEESFLRTLEAGITYFETLVPHVLSAREGGTADIGTDSKAVHLLMKAYSGFDREGAVTRFNASSQAGAVAGEIAFLLHDTYGFPVDLTRLMAREEGLDVEMARFDELMGEQRERARAATQFRDIQVASGSSHDIGDLPETRFVGYQMLEYEGAEILSTVQVDDDTRTLHRIVLNTTPFYAESGGQIGDTGLITIGSKAVRVIDTQKSSGVYYHLVEGPIPSDVGPVTATVDVDRRNQILKHHTATHLMHAALRQRLGTHVEQRGSLVAPDRLRFDFSHFEKVDAESLAAIADRVNNEIQRNVQGQIEEDVPIEEARGRGAMMLFGEKYGDTVRVVTFDPEVSVELCGGTHVDATGEIGLFQFVSEGSIATGIRRVEAVVGRAALQLVYAERNELRQVRGQFKSLEQPAGLEVANLVAESKRLKKELEKSREQALAGDLRGFVDRAVEVDGATLATGCFEDVEMDTLVALGERLRGLLGAGAVGIIGSSDRAAGKAYLVATVSDDLIAERGIKAGTLVGEVARLIGGGGGGRPTLASAGGRSPEKLEPALLAAPRILSEMLNQ
jgi:alanyl-tRNA synthetase